MISLLTKTFKDQIWLKSDLYILKHTERTLSELQYRVRR